MTSSSLSVLGLVLALPAVSAASPRPDPRVASIVAAVSERRLARDVETLVGFGTRHTLSADAPERGIGAARRWIADEMRRAGSRLVVSFDTYSVAKQGDRITRDVELSNVIAVLPGRTPRRLYVTAHYDSVARIPPPAGEAGPGRFDWSRADGSAPGADDDASGTALVLELARVFAGSDVPFDATLVFAAFAGEEQGLIGSGLHAQKERESGVPIDAVLNNDIVGGIAAADGGDVDRTHVRVFSEGPEDGASRELARHVRRQAALYVPGHEVVLVARADRFGRGGDHLSFDQRGYAAVRVTEAREFLEHQHSVDDTTSGVSPAYLAQNARVNAAAMAVLALAPAAPVVVDAKGQPTIGRGPSGGDADLHWAASAGAAGYVVFSRPCWEPDWRHERRVDGTGLLLAGVSIDDNVFGVAAVDGHGNESLVSAYVAVPFHARPIRTSAPHAP